MKSLGYSLLTFLLLLILGAVSPAFAQRPSPQVQHRVQVRVYLPDGVDAEQVVRVQLDSEQSMTPLQFRNLMRDSVVEFTQISNGDYILTITSTGKTPLETYTERISLRSNFPQARQVNVFLNRQAVTTKEATRSMPATVDASQLAEVPKAAKKAFEKGLSKSGKGKTDEAIKAFEEALTVYPNYFEALNNLAVSYIELRRFDDARSRLEQASKLSPNSPLPYLNFGILLIEEKRYKEAIEVLERSISIDTTNPLSHYQLGIAYFQVSNFQKAAEEFETTVASASKKLPLSRLYLADIYKRLSKTDDAIKQIESFLSEMPENPYSDVARQELAKLKKK
ncbi:MAG: tetratricopeptide repeat protein [Blastocatellia bacterium]|nr:tetratricopeptide repeat protein [Blastocatellia bacterium]